MKTNTTQLSLSKKISARVFVILGIVLLAIMLSACTNTATPTYYTGTDGLKMEFLKENPGELFENESFAIGLLIRNRGPYAINSTDPAKINIMFDEKYLKREFIERTTTDSDYENIFLEARSMSNPLGDEKYYEFDFVAKEFSSKRESVTTKISYTLCYPYQTVLSTDVCIDAEKNLLVSASNKACIVKEYSGGQGQGGPLVISRVIPEVHATGRYIQPSFQIYLENKGEGYVLNAKDDQYTCDFRDFSNSENWNKISVQAQLSGQDLICTPKELRLLTTENYVRCRLPVALLENYSRGKNNYASILTVTLNYGYYSTKTMDITIKSDSEFSLQPFVQSNSTCGPFEKSDGIKCISKCEYCVKNPGDSACQVSKQKYGNFTFTTDVDCSCTRQQCIQKNQKGECVYGYCPGSLYCCLGTKA